MGESELPRRPGEPAPGDAGKKGGLPDDDKPIIDEPTDLPPKKKEGPIKQPTI